MFLEPHFKGQRSGWIEVVCGPMFSGKTEELIRRLKRAKIANQKVAIYKPAKDTRYDKKNVVSHDANFLVSTAVSNSKELLTIDRDINVVGIDEAQFFDDDLPEVVQELAMNGIRVVMSGLDMDFKGKPFGCMPALLAVAEYVTKLHAICMHCGNLATHSYRMSEEQDTVMLGETDVYEARCRTCYAMGNILRLR